MKKPFRDIDVERDFCKESTLNFTRYMFKKNWKRKFVVGEHHRVICDYLDKVLQGEITRLIINIAPRYGKTELISKQFIAKGLAHNPKSKFLMLSYSDDLVLDNSREVRNIVTSDYYQRLFPEVQVIDKSAKKWYTSVGGGVYAVSAAGQVTGFGAGQVDEEESEEHELEEEKNIDEFTAVANSVDFAGAIIIDDPLKPEDAVQDVLRERVNNRFESTIRSRANSRKTPIIIVMQRVHERDLCGYLQEVEPDEWTVLSLPCIWHDETGEERPLWEFKHTLEELHKIEKASPYVFETQYMQNPKPKEGLMYPSFKTYETLPVGPYMVKNYTDSADKGKDYLCSITYVEYLQTHECYVLDVLFTDKSMEYTEPELARRLTRYKCQLCTIESNNGGRGFRRNVERNCREMNNLVTRFVDFTQTENKDARIFAHSVEVVNLVYFPVNWSRMWREYYNAMTRYRKSGGNAHDDAPDATTGIVEHLNSSQTSRFSRT